MKSKEMCSGCYNNFYNLTREKGCWMFESARIVERTPVGTWDNPPYKWNPRIYLSCFNKPGVHLLKRDDPRMEE